VPACVDHLRQPQGDDCLTLGCRARRACPIGRDYHYASAQAHLHMSAFVKSN
jgi:epoxyqueuosine reductase